MTPWQILDIPPGSDRDTIDRAYRKQSMRWHPDRPDGSTERMQEINAAYAELTDPPDDREDAGYLVELFRNIIRTTHSPVHIHEIALEELDAGIERLSLMYKQGMVHRERLSVLKGRVKRRTDGANLFDVVVQEELDAIATRMHEQQQQIERLRRVRLLAEQYEDQVSAMLGRG